MHYYRFEANGNIEDCELELVKLKPKFRKKVNGEGNSNVRISVPLKNLSNFRRTLKILLIDCETNYILIWSAIRVIDNSTDSARTEKVDTKL